MERSERNRGRKKILRMFWNTVLKKLFKDTVNVSSHAFEKNKSNSGSISGFFENGRAKNESMDMD